MSEGSQMAFGAVLVVAGLAAGEYLGQERVDRAEARVAEMQHTLEGSLRHDTALQQLRQRHEALWAQHERLWQQQQALVGALQAMADCVVPGAWMDMGVVPLPDVMRAGDLTGEPVED